ncbi:hypothetical protein DPX16_8987 [Anabarilius grahami]|uniref:Uncharacterized protein n=1 Tax=Anabarilius grahami TaxID=495550 RepID=A0A3N0XD04_ANAGA|nr:hypothetical protein DPX16_8987 [Anabarilius grahami]
MPKTKKISVIGQTASRLRLKGFRSQEKTTPGVRSRTIRHRMKQPQTKRHQTKRTQTKRHQIKRTQKEANCSASM